MNIELKEFTIRDIANGYINDNENGVVGFDKKLNIRPKYQREFVYNDEKREAVMLREVIESREFEESNSKISFALRKRCWWK